MENWKKVYKFFKENDLEEIKIEFNNNIIRYKKQHRDFNLPVSAVNVHPETTQEDLPSSDKEKYYKLKSPIAGTFYRKPSPEKDAFVKENDIIKKGDTLCIIEAMKVFNEIKSTVDGKIIKIMAEDTSPIAKDQVLFLIDEK